MKTRSQLLNKRPPFALDIVALAPTREEFRRRGTTSYDSESPGDWDAWAKEVLEQVGRNVSARHVLASAKPRIPLPDTKHDRGECASRCIPNPPPSRTVQASASPFHVRRGSLADSQTAMVPRRCGSNGLIQRLCGEVEWFSTAELRASRSEPVHWWRRLSAMVVGLFC